MKNSIGRSVLLIAIFASLVMPLLLSVVPAPTYAAIPPGGNLRVGLIATGPIMYIEGRGVQSAGPAILMENVMVLAHETFAQFGPDGNLIPLTIESWGVSEDGLAYTFTIRENATWSDGTDVTTADAQLTYEIISAFPDIDQWGIAGYIESLEEVDDKTFIVHLKERFSPFLHYWLMLEPYPAHYWESIEAFNATGATEETETIGVGPFKIVGFSPGASVIRMVPNEYYWGGESYISDITITLLSPDANVPALMAAGEFDLIEVPSSSQVASILGIQNVDVTLSSTKHYGGWQMARWAGVLVNCLKAPLDNVDFRRAIAYGLNRDEIVELTAGGYGTVASYGFLPSDYTEWLAPDLPTYERDVAKAKELIEGLGFVEGADGFYEYANGTSLTLEVMARGGTETLIATVMAQRLKDIGLNVLTRTLSSTVYVNNYNYGYYDLGVIMTNHPLSLDFVLNKFYYPDVTPIGETTFYRGWDRWANARFDELMELSRGSISESDLHEYYNEAQEILADNLPFLSIYYANHIWAHRADTFEGWDLLFEDYTWPMKEIVLDIHLPEEPEEPEPQPAPVPIELYAAVGVSAVIAIAAVIYALTRR